MNRLIVGLALVAGAALALPALAQKKEEPPKKIAIPANTFIKSQTGTSGVLDMRDKSADAEIKRITAQADLAETRIQAKEKRLKAQFAAMETALLNSQSQSAWLSGQLSSLS